MQSTPCSKNLKKSLCIWPSYDPKYIECFTQCNILILPHQHNGLHWLINIRITTGTNVAAGLWKCARILLIVVLFTTQRCFSRLYSTSGRHWLISYKTLWGLATGLILMRKPTSLPRADLSTSYLGGQHWLVDSGHTVPVKWLGICRIYAVILLTNCINYKPKNCFVDSADFRAADFPRIRTLDRHWCRLHTVVHSVV